MYETPATSAHAHFTNLSTPAHMQDFEADESAFPIIHARGLTEAPVMPQKPYVYGQSTRWARRELERCQQHLNRFPRS